MSAFSLIPYQDRLRRLAGMVARAGADRLGSGVVDALLSVADLVEMDRGEVERLMHASPPPDGQIDPLTIGTKTEALDVLARYSSTADRSDLREMLERAKPLRVRERNEVVDALGQYVPYVAWGSELAAHLRLDRVVYPKHDTLRPGFRNGQKQKVTTGHIPDLAVDSITTVFTNGHLLLWEQNGADNLLGRWLKKHGPSDEPFPNWQAVVPDLMPDEWRPVTWDAYYIASATTPLHGSFERDGLTVPVGISNEYYALLRKLYPGCTIYARKPHRAMLIRDANEKAVGVVMPVMRNTVDAPRQNPAPEVSDLPTLAYLGTVERFRYRTQRGRIKTVTGGRLFGTADRQMLYIVPERLVTARTGVPSQGPALSAFEAWAGYDADGGGFAVELPVATEPIGTATEIVYRSDKLVQAGDTKGTDHRYIHAFDAGLRPVASGAGVHVITADFNHRGILN